MSNHRDPLIEPMALAFATAKFTDWLNRNPNAAVDEQIKSFYDFFEGGLYVATTFCNENPGL